MVGRGCVLSFGVVIGAGVAVPPFTRLTLSDAKDDDDDVFDDDDDQEEDEEDEGGVGGKKQQQEQGLLSVSSVGAEDAAMLGLTPEVFLVIGVRGGNWRVVVVVVVSCDGVCGEER